jgi:hypothetical protein
MGHQFSLWRTLVPRDAREVVMSYITAMDNRDYAAARHCLEESVFIKGPAGEAFRSPDDFPK